MKTLRKSLLTAIGALAFAASASSAVHADTIRVALGDVASVDNPPFWSPLNAPAKRGSTTN